jgi:type I restriction enzyme S subunit
VGGCRGSLSPGQGHRGYGELIEGLERLKRGLMQELLTKGIGHKEFQETPIGKIPKEWKIVRLEEVTRIIKTGPFGSQLRKRELTNEGIRVYTQENVLRRDFSIGNLYISREKFEQLKNFEVKPNDVLLTIRGTIGKAVVVPQDIERGIIHTNLAIIRVDTTKLMPHYLELIINESDIIVRQVKASRSSTTLPALYAGTIKRLKIPFPSLEEQKTIVNVLSSVNKWIEIEKKRKEKFERLKRGLMELLLTGKVRVRVVRVS